VDAAAGEVRAGTGNLLAGRSQAVTFTIYGEPASKSNSRKLVTIGRGKFARPRIIKSAKALLYVESLREQADAIWRKRELPMLTGRLRLEATIYYASERPDLDGSLILDGLQGIAFKNDRQVREQVWTHRVDRVMPRAEITLAEVV
jgi:Holliday junction resolvase RusA-like endonuclease